MAALADSTLHAHFNVPLRRQAGLEIKEAKKTRLAVAVFGAAAAWVLIIEVRSLSSTRSVCASVLQDAL